MEKYKKTLDILSFHTCVQLIKIIWYMVPEIWRSITGGTFWSSWAIFWPITTLTPWKMKISKIKKPPWRYHHFTQVYQKSWSSAIYCSRDMTHGRCNCYFHFGLSDIFPSTFLQPVNGHESSILNWVIKLNLIKLPMKFYSSKKHCCRCRQMMCRLCFCIQRGCWK